MPYKWVYQAMVPTDSREADARVRREFMNDWNRSSEIVECGEMDPETDLIGAGTRASAGGGEADLYVALIQVYSAFYE